MDCILHPISDLLSCLRDGPTGDFLKQLDEVNINENDANISVVSLDVTSLYTNVPHDIGWRL